MSYLYLKDNLVMTLKDVDGIPAEISKINNPELLPIILQKDCSFEKFKSWLDKRNIPVNKREGLDETIKIFGRDWLENKNYASLSDQYWIKMRTESYKKVNFFTNIYSSDVGDMMFKPWTINKKKIDNKSPDLSTNGLLKKRWIQDVNTKKSQLVKAGSMITKQEPLSEVLVSVLAEHLGKIECVKYDLHIEGATMCSICDNFVNENTMLVPAYYLYYAEDRNKAKEDIMTHLLRMCEKFDVPNAESHIRWTLFLDTLTGNDDRNLGNIGFLMDVNTMKFIGPAPMYDSGNSYWSSEKVDNSIKSKFFGDVELKNFKNMKERKEVLEFLSEDKAYIHGYEKLIRSYPCITDVKKENLINAIKNRNNKLLLYQRPEFNLDNIDRA